MTLRALIAGQCLSLQRTAVAGLSHLNRHYADTLMSARRQSLPVDFNRNENQRAGEQKLHH
jgi:hypothetical protein